MVISTEMCVSKYLVQDDLWWHRGWRTPANKSLSSLLGSSWVVMRHMSFRVFTVSLAKGGSCPAWVILHQCGSTPVMRSVILEQSIITVSNTCPCFYLHPSSILSCFFQSFDLQCIRHYFKYYFVINSGAFTHAHSHSQSIYGWFTNFYT